MEQSGEVAEFTEHFWRFTAKQHSPKQLEYKQGLALKHKKEAGKKKKKKKKLVRCNPSLGKPQDLKLTWKNIIYAPGWQAVQLIFHKVLKWYSTCDCQVASVRQSYIIYIYAC